MEIITQNGCVSVHEYIEIKSSGIHRHGVFAKKDIPKGLRIIEYTGRKISKEEGDRILKETFHKHQMDPENHAGTYIFELDDMWDIDGDTSDNDAKYINHSCNPNCKMDITNGEIWIYAIKDISKGEEITYNYGFEINEKNLYDFEEQECRCGSDNCVGYMLDEDAWPRMRELLAKKKKHN